jgi:hypothetical protein
MEKANGKFVIDVKRLWTTAQANAYAAIVCLIVLANLFG